MMLRRAILFVSVFALSLLLWSTAARAQESGSFVGGAPGPGISFAVYSGGLATDLPLAAPDAASFWVPVDGSFLGYLAGSPSFVNQAFLDHFAAGIPPNTPLIVLTPEDTAHPEPPVEAWSLPVTIQQPVIATAGGGTAYDRDEWQHWTDDDSDCQNTRAEVLIAESTAAVTFTSASSGCTVATGAWVGPFTGQTFTAASDVDVDHMVPLKNAHDSGAWAWSSARKRDYANDLSDPQHLIAVDDGTNQSKGARGPEEWKPPLECLAKVFARDAEMSVDQGQMIDVHLAERDPRDLRLGCAVDTNDSQTSHVYSSWYSGRLIGRTVSGAVAAPVRSTNGDSSNSRSPLKERIGIESSSDAQSVVG